MPSWTEHIDLVQSLIAALLLIITWAARSWLQSQTDINRAIIDEQKVIHGRITTVEKDLSKLIGAHEANHP